MITLSLDTSTLLGSVAIHQNSTLLTQRSLMRQNSHSDTLNELIEECLIETKLSLNQVDQFATGLGPGSFTGIRIAFNTAKTFSAIYNKPIVGIDSLTNLAHTNSHIDGDLVCLVNAFKNMVYVAVFNCKNKKIITLKQAQVVRVQELKNFIENKAYFIGDGYEAYKNYLETQLTDKILRHTETYDYPTAATLGKLASLEIKKNHWSELTPLYLRASEAEENMNGIKYQPL